MDKKTSYTQMELECVSSPTARCARLTQMGARKSSTGEDWLEGTIMVGMSLALNDTEI